MMALACCQIICIVLFLLLPVLLHAQLFEQKKKVYEP